MSYDLFINSFSFYLKASLARVVQRVQEDGEQVSVRHDISIEHGKTRGIVY